MSTPVASNVSARQGNTPQSAAIQIQPLGGSTPATAPTFPTGTAPTRATPTPHSPYQLSQSSPPQTTVTTAAGAPSAPLSPNLSQTTSTAPTIAPPQNQTPSAPYTPGLSAPRSKAPRKWAPIVRAFLLYLMVAVIFIFVSLIAIQGQSTDWVLARLTPTSGILLLSFLSKLIDWGLGGTTDKAWTMLQWGPILRGSKVKKNMLTFLTLGARLDGSIKVLFNRLAWSNSSPGLKRWISWGRFVNYAGIWALMKFFIWILVQFPGLIIMAVVEPQTQYIASNFEPISGGIGLFDPSTIMPQIQGPAISNYIYTVLDDPRFTFRADGAAASIECQFNSSCQSYIMTGGIANINPLPNRRVNDKELTAYTARDVPSYQLDAWDLSNTPTNFTFGDCELYNANVTDSFGFYLCMKNDEDGSVLAGYAPCYPWAGQGQCRNDIPPTITLELNIWITKLTIYRLTATFTADRRTGIILSLPSSSPPIQQQIAASSFRDAIDNLICPNVTATPNEMCDRMLPNFLLTDSISNLLATVAGLEYSPGMTVLQNLFTTSLFLFTPVWMTQLGVGLDVTLGNGTVPGLPDENYFTGSTARPVDYVAPSFWTVVAFTAAGGLLLLLCLVAMVVSVGVAGGGSTGGVGVGETSSFPLIDAGQLVVADSRGRVKGLADVFVGGVEDRDVIRVAAESEIRVR